MSITGPSDLRDEKWLAERIDTARNGIEAVIDIAMNWTEGRNVSRLHPGVAAADYVRENVGVLGREAIIPLLTESNWSNRQIAAVAGVGEATVRRTASSGAVERPAKTLGADGKERRAPARKEIVIEVPADDPVLDDDDDDDEGPGMDPAVVWLEAFSSSLNARGGISRLWDGLRRDDQVILQSVLGRLIPALQEITERTVKDS